MLAGHQEIVGFLIEAGATPDVTDKQGDTPESWALEWENYKCAMILADATKQKVREREKAEEEARKKAAAEKTKKLAMQSFDLDDEEDDDEEDDDEEEELTHWVLPAPLPRTIPEQQKTGGSETKTESVPKQTSSTEKTDNMTESRNVSMHIEEKIKIAQPEEQELGTCCDQTGSASLQSEKDCSGSECIVKVVPVLDTPSIKVHQPDREMEYSKNGKIEEPETEPEMVPLAPPPPPHVMIPLPPPPPPPPPPPCMKSTKETKQKKTGDKKSSNVDPHANLMNELKSFAGARRKVKIAGPVGGKKQQNPENKITELENSAPNVPKTPLVQPVSPLQQEDSGSHQCLDDEAFVQMMLHGTTRKSEAGGCGDSQQRSSTNSPSIVDKIKNSLSPYPETKPVPTLIPRPAESTIPLPPEQTAKKPDPSRPKNEDSSPSKRNSALNPLPPPTTGKADTEFDKLVHLTEDSGFSIDLRKSAADLVSLTR